MSLVGPRPIVPDEIAEYGDYGRMLLRVKPGLTGLWQVSGRSTIGYPERARIDLRYVGERSLRSDLAHPAAHAAGGHPRSEASL